MAVIGIIRRLSSLPHPINTPAVSIATVRVRPSEDAAFTAWKARHDVALDRFPGFVSSDILPPSASGGTEWTIIVTFRTPAELAAWQQSSERSDLIRDGATIFEGGTFAEIEQPGNAGTAPETQVTEVVFSKVKPGQEATYREWAARIQAAQARHPGYRGTFLQPPEEPGGFWTTILRYDTAAHLEGWMHSPERRQLIAEARDFIEHEHLTRLATSFPGWVPIDPMTGEGPPNWKAALLVLLGLFPIVMLEMRYLSPVLTSLGLHASLATFIGNAISVALTSFATMPLCVRAFGWWLFPEGPRAASATTRGVALLAVLFTAEVLILWRLLPW